MDKKNTMLLTVIAVATLLVAVVGATFAYYSVYSSNTVGNTQVQAYTGTTGTATLTTEDNTLYINMTTENMLIANYGTYYATSSNEPAVKNTAATHTLATIASTNSTANQTYSCTFKMNIAFANNSGSASAWAALSDADGGYTFTIGSGVTVQGITSGTKYGYATLKTMTGDHTGTVTFNGDQSATITGQMVFENLQDDTQNDLAGLDMKVDVTFSDFSCTSTISSGS